VLQMGSAVAQWLGAVLQIGSAVAQRLRCCATDGQYSSTVVKVLCYRWAVR